MFPSLDRVLFFFIVPHLLIVGSLYVTAGVSNALESVPDLEKVMYISAKGYPCIRLLNCFGEVGCSNPGQKMIVGPVFRLQKIDNVLENSFAVLIHLDELENLLLRISSDPKLAQRIAGVLVEATLFVKMPLGFSPDGKFPQAAFTPYRNASFEWNPHGSGIMWNQYNFPIFLLYDESTKMLQEMAIKNENNIKSYPSAIVEFDLVMQTTKSQTHNSSSCLKEQTCLPLGGYSVWSALPPIEITAEPPKSILLVMASMDTGSFFRDLSIGADSPLSGLIALLAAVDSFSQIINLTELKKQLVFAVFTGEAWGYLGSRRFLLELELGADSVKGLNHEMIEQVLEIGSVGKGLSQGTVFFAHPAQDTSLTNEILAALQKASISLGSDNVIVRKANVSNPGVPPSSLMTFLNKNSSISGVVLEDFDASFINNFYHSHLDDASNVNASSIAAAAIIVARALYILASDNGSSMNLVVLNSIKVNVSLVEELVGCLLTCEPGFSCDIVMQYISPSNACPNHYVGVFVGSPSETQQPQYADDTSRFIWNFLADRTSVPQRNRSASCKGDCPNPTDVCVAAETESSKCVTSTTRYVPSYSTRLKFEGSSWLILPPNLSVSLDLADPIWTESYWNTIGLRVYTVQRSAYDNLVLLIGVVITLATFIATSFARTFLLKALKQD